MNYEIYGGHFPAVTIQLDRGESIITQSGGLAWMSDGISMSTNMQGGFLRSLGRMFSGDSLFIATYTADRDDQEITLSASLPGEIRKFTIDESHSYIAQKGAFLGASPTVDIDATISKKFAAGLFGGEGFIMQQYTGYGDIFVELDGSIREIDLAPGQRVKVDTANVAMFEASVDYDVETIKGFKNILFGGEGLFLTVLTGPGKVWLQTMTARDLAGRISPFLPQPSNVTISADK